MGEHNARFLVRAGGVVAVSVAAVVALSSCSLLRVAPSPVATSSPQQTTTTDPSTPSSTPQTSDSSTPDPAATAWSPEPTPTLTTVPGSTKKAVAPFITFASWDASRSQLQVGTIVPGVVESGGTCTVTATRDGVTRTATATGTGVSSYTGCNPMTISGTALDAGTWTLRVQYTSKTAEGTSSAQTVEVTK